MIWITKLFVTARIFTFFSLDDRGTGRIFTFFSLDDRGTGRIFTFFSLDDRGTGRQSLVSIVCLQ